MNLKRRRQLPHVLLLLRVQQKYEQLLQLLIDRQAPLQRLLQHHLRLSQHLQQPLLQQQMRCWHPQEMQEPLRPHRQNPLHSMPPTQVNQQLYLAQKILHLQRQLPHRQVILRSQLQLTLLDAISTALQPPWHHFQVLTLLQLHHERFHPNELFQLRPLRQVCARHRQFLLLPLVHHPPLFSQHQQLLSPPQLPQLLYWQSQQQLEQPCGHHRPSWRQPQHQIVLSALLLAQQRHRPSSFQRSAKQFVRLKVRHR